jgi:hypothetical protein
MNEPIKPAAIAPVVPETSQDAELNDSEVEKIQGGAFDAYLYFPPAPKH